MLHALHRYWGYSPVEALQAPMAVWRMTEILIAAEAD